ncbi:MAG: YlmC/YmxH family sporulation protein [Firmicutes bacterium]|nr:YlmC/YmxH family sporulation protein [Bacillota bacterium]
MELSQLSRKEIINLYDGSRLGYVGESDLVIDDKSGRILAMVIYPKGLSAKVRNTRELVIPWQAVKKIGEEIMVVEIVPERSSHKFSFHE